MVGKKVFFYTIFLSETKKLKRKEKRSIFILLRGEVRAGGKRTTEKEWETVTVLL